MRVVVQRVSQSNVKVSGEVIGEIKEGLMVLVSFVDEDNDTDLGWMTKKIINLRIFNDDEGKMNRSVQDVGGDILLISQFTLHGSTKKGNRPSFIKAAKPDLPLAKAEHHGQHKTAHFLRLGCFVGCYPTPGSGQFS